MVEVFVVAVEVGDVNIVAVVAGVVFSSGHSPSSSSPWSEHATPV